MIQNLPYFFSTVFNSKIFSLFFFCFFFGLKSGFKILSSVLLSKKKIGYYLSDLQKSFSEFFQRLFSLKNFKKFFHKPFDPK